jgi:hypothetical protein
MNVKQQQGEVGQTEVLWRLSAASKQARPQRRTFSVLVL